MNNDTEKNFGTHFQSIDEFQIVVGARIRQARQRRGTTLREVANKTGISMYLLSRFENGQRPIRLEQTARIAQVLDVPIADIVSVGLQSDANVSGNPSSVDQTTLEDCAPRFEARQEQDAEFSMLTEYFDRLNAVGRHEAVKRVEEMTHLPRYQRRDPEQTTGKE